MSDVDGVCDDVSDAVIFLLQHELYEVAHHVIGATSEAEVSCRYSFDFPRH